MLPGFKSLTLTRETDSQSGVLCEDSPSLAACLSLHAMSAAPLCTATQEQESEASGCYSSLFVIPLIQPFYINITWAHGVDMQIFSSWSITGQVVLRIL